MTVPSKVTLSKERVEDSSDENTSESNEEATRKPTINGHAQPDIPKLRTLSYNEQQVSESDTSTSGSDTRSNTAPKRRATSPPKQRSQSLPKRKKTNPDNVKRIEASQYAPPRGYAPVSLETNGRGNNPAIFSNMEGKQVWHISAPATASISQIRSLDLQAVLRGKTILEQKSTKYTMRVNDVESATILISDKVDAAYLPTNLKISRSFHIEETTKASDTPVEKNNAPSELNPTILDNTDSANHNFFATQSGQKKIPRKQPENLKARYVPFGVPIDRPNITDLQQPRKSREAVTRTTHQDHSLNSPDSDSAMSGVEVETGHEKTWPKSDTEHLPQSSAPASTPSKTPNKAKKRVVGASMQDSQPQTPSSTTKSHKEKKKHKRDGVDDMENSAETSMSTLKAGHKSPVSANMSSMPASSGEKKRKAH